MEWLLIIFFALLCVWCYFYGRETGYQEGKADALWQSLELQRKLERQKFQYMDIGCPPGYMPRFDEANIRDRQGLISRNFLGSRNG